jgi:hypothetical protein
MICFQKYGIESNKHHVWLLSPLIRVNPGSIFGWGLIFIFGGLVNFLYKF